MTRTRDTVRDTVRDTATFLGLSWLWITLGGVTLAAIAAASIWIATASSSARGNAGVTRQHNSTGNQVAQNTKLLGDQATVLSDQQKIQVLAAGQQTQQDRIDLSGLQQNCASDVTAYNADVQNILAQGYLPAGLPSSYPSTICEVTNS